KIRGQLVVQCWCEERMSRWKLLQAEVCCRVEIRDENDRAIVAPVLVDVTQQRLGIRSLVADEVFLQRHSPVKLRHFLSSRRRDWTKLFQQATVQPGPVNTASDSHWKPDDPHFVFGFRSFR